MASFTKLNGFVEHLAQGVHNLNTGAITVALSNTAPGSESTPPRRTTYSSAMPRTASSKRITTHSSAKTGTGE